MRNRQAVRQQVPRIAIPRVKLSPYPPRAHHVPVIVVLSIGGAGVAKPQVMTKLMGVHLNVRSVLQPVCVLINLRHGQQDCAIRQAIAQKILYLVEKPEKSREMGKNARQVVEEKFNIEKRIDKIIEIYQQLSKK